MEVFAVCLVLLLAMAGNSDAAYCICNSGGDSTFQKNIDYACGAGADCSPILQNGACFNPNTLRDHCNYAVNSYYQRKGQIQGSCDFAGTASVSSTAPTNAGSGCVYQSSPSGGGSTTPTTNPTFGGGSTTPTTNPTFGGTPNTSTGGTNTSTGTTPGSTFTPGTGFGMAPAGTGFGSTDGSGTLLPHISTTFMLLSFSFTFLVMCPRI